MTIARLIIDGHTSKADHLDLILSLKSIKTNHIKVIYRDGRSLSKRRTEFLRNNQGVWFMIKDKGIKCDRPIRIEGLSICY